MGMYGENAGDSDAITRDFFDSLLIETRYIDAEKANTEFRLWGETFATPVTTAALSHLDGIAENGMARYARGAKDANALHFMGMGEDAELEAVVKTGAKTVKIIKPHADNDEVYRKIAHAVSAGAFAVGMDIDHAFNANGGYDCVNGLPMKPKSFDELSSFVRASAVPFVVKGVLSVRDAVKCAKAGVKGIVLSHHHNIMPYSVPPLFALSAIKKEVGADMMIFVDCGIASAPDVFKALALGADAVSVGRALMDAVKSGAGAVTEGINGLTCGIASIMARTGIRSLHDMDSSVIHRRTF